MDDGKTQVLSTREVNIVAVKTREEIIEEIKARVGEQTDDETIGFLEDITDTFSDLETKAKGDGIDWETKYKENDEEWRKRYTERFYSSAPEDKPTSTKQDDTQKPNTFAELFTTVEQ